MCISTMVTNKMLFAPAGTEEYTIKYTIISKDLKFLYTCI